jgi:hypothetical protein
MCVVRKRLDAAMSATVSDTAEAMMFTALPAADAR